MTSWCRDPVLLDSINCIWVVVHSVVILTSVVVVDSMGSWEERPSMIDCFNKLIASNVIVPMISDEPTTNTIKLERTSCLHLALRRLECRPDVCFLCPDSKVDEVSSNTSGWISNEEDLTNLVIAYISKTTSLCFLITFCAYTSWTTITTGLIGLLVLKRCGCGLRNLNRILDYI